MLLQLLGPTPSIFFISLEVDAKMHQDPLEEVRSISIIESSLNRRICSWESFEQFFDMSESSPYWKNGECLKCFLININGPCSWSPFGQLLYICVSNPSWNCIYHVPGTYWANSIAFLCKLLINTYGICCTCFMWLFLRVSSLNPHQK